MQWIGIIGRLVWGTYLECFSNRRSPMNFFADSALFLAALFAPQSPYLSRYARRRTGAVARDLTVALGL